MTTGRRELTWLACDALAALGRKPSIASVREWTIVNHGRKQGSDTDTQADINAWYGVLLGMKQQHQSIEGLPAEIAEMARQLWRKASDAAAEALTDERSAMDDKLIKAQSAVNIADQATATALERVASITHTLDVARESIRRLEDAISTAHVSLQSSQAHHALQIEAKDEKHAAMAHEATKKEADHVARLAELDGLRKHALLQIEQARAEARGYQNTLEKVTFAHQAALAAERQATALATAELAGATGRLSAVEEALASSQQRSTALEETLAQSRKQVVTDVQAIPVKKSGMVRASKSMAFRRHKR